MDKLEGVSSETLREKLAAAESPKAVKRLMVALAYKDGVAVTTLADRYGIPKSTLYYWLDRLDEKPLDTAVEDDERPGRPSELDREQRRQLFDAVADDPRTYGYDAAEWTPELVRHYVEREFGVSYSVGHVRRLLREAGVNPA